MFIASFQNLLNMDLQIFLDKSLYACFSSNRCEGLLSVASTLISNILLCTIGATPE